MKVVIRYNGNLYMYVAVFLHMASRNCVFTCNACACVHIKAMCAKHVYYCNYMQGHVSMFTTRL